METAVLTVPASSAEVEINGVKYSEKQLEDLVVKLTKLRDDVVAGVHPRLKSHRLVDEGRPPSVAISATTVPSAPNGVTKSAAIVNAPTTKPVPTTLPPKPLNNISQPAAAPPPPVAHLSRPSVGTLQFDPIFLTKADVLVKAEAKQKRQRLEHSLEEQVQQKKAMMKHRTFDQDALPQFDVAEAFKKARESVKPLLRRHEIGRQAGATSTDSFDENTFYSSQMTESSSTEEGEEPRRPHPRPNPQPLPQTCRFFVSGKHCPYGDNCIFPHDQASQQISEGKQTSRVDQDRSDIGGKPNNRRNQLSPSAVDKDVRRPNKPNQEAAEVSQQERIAQLEAELRAMKEGKGQGAQVNSISAPRERPDSRDDSVYSPPGPDEFGRDASLRDRNIGQQREVQRPHGSANLTLQRNGSRRVASNRSPPLPHNDGQVVRNHITSPYAPQPARVSPLAVAKVSQATSNRQARNDYRYASTVVNIHETNTHQSPNMPLSAPSSRKRRRGPEADDDVRNVIPRRNHSPEIRIKQEPVSPDPFNASVSRRLPLALETTQQRGLAANPLQHMAPNHVVYPNRDSQRPASVYEIHEPADARPLSSIGSAVPRIRSRNQNIHRSNEDSDLRRVISERQIRAPASLVPQYYDNPEQTQRVRAVSQVQMAPGRHNAYVRGTSARPSGDAYVPSRQSFSPPPPREIQASPAMSHVTHMAPPPRRILMDQYGNRIYEPQERQISMAPPSRLSQLDAPYERHVRAASIRQPAYPEQSFAGPVQQIPQPTSPLSPQYYTDSAHYPQMVSRSDNLSEPYYESRQTRPQVIYQEVRQPPFYGEVGDRRDGYVRVQSVRPLEDSYEIAGEPNARMSSVRPQPRIIPLGDGRAASPQVGRQASIRPQSNYVGYPGEERATYQYMSSVPEPRQDLDMADEGFYDPSRRVVHRL